MRNLLFNSLLIFSLFLSSACANQSQQESEATGEDTSQVVISDSIPKTVGDTVQSPTIGAGDTVKAQSSSTKSSPGTTVKNPGAIKKHGGPNQAETDSIKRAKTKGKK